MPWEVPMVEQVLRLDVWGGERSMEHVSRSHHAEMDASVWQRVRNEVAAGYLVNLRGLGPGEGWGPNLDFDERTGSVSHVQ
jgi:hypothetical protein